MENTVVTTPASSPSSLEKLLAERDADLAKITPGNETYEDSNVANALFGSVAETRGACSLVGIAACGVGARCLVGRAA